jgi:hypothetical protein
LTAHPWFSPFSFPSKIPKIDTPLVKRFNKRFLGAWVHLQMHPLGLLFVIKAASSKAA